LRALFLSLETGSQACFGVASATPATVAGFAVVRAKNTMIAAMIEVAARP